MAHTPGDLPPASYDPPDEPDWSHPATSADAFEALDHAHQQLQAAEVAELVAIAHAADLYQVDINRVLDGMERLIPGGHHGTPLVGEFLSLEIGGLLGISPRSAANRIAQALDLRHRFPHLWQRVLAGEARVWQANLVVDRTILLDIKAAQYVDARVAATLPRHGIGWVMKHLQSWIDAADPKAAFDRVNAEIKDRRVLVSGIENGSVTMWGQLSPADGIRFDHALTQIAENLPDDHRAADDSLDARRAAAVGILARQAFGQGALPTHTLVVHINASDPALNPGKVNSPNTTDGSGETHTTGLADGPACPPAGIARVEGWGHLLTTLLPDFLAGSKVIVRPVIDPTTITPVNGYEVPDRMRFVIEQRNPVDVFPYGTRSAKGCDMDHTIPYTLGEPDQTRLDNLGPLSRFAHRAKTHGGWHLEQPAPGHFKWTSPAGYQYLVTPDGTTTIGKPETHR
ncbi:MAG: DUF222 domain-containing protein [Brooklawnia sp.]